MDKRMKKGRGIVAPALDNPPLGGMVVASPALYCPTWPSYRPRASATSDEKSVWWCTIFHPSVSRR